MRTAFTYAVWISFTIGVLVLANEFLNCWRIKNQILRNEPFLPESSETYKLAVGNLDFIDSQSKAISRRLKTIPTDILKHFLVLAAVMAILMANFKKTIQGAVSSVVELFPKVGNSSRLKETAFVSFIITFLIASVFAGSPIIYRAVQGESTILISIMVYLSLAFIFIPFVYLIFKKLLKFYSGRLIAACYLAYYVKSISEFVTVEDVNLVMMRKLDITEFSKGVVDYLKERRLENRVYGEKKKSETLNAALVGWGSLERIEIYGDHKNLTDAEFESVLMHEIGHSQDFSLFKKLAVLFTVKFIEMLIVFHLFFDVSEKYSDEFISKYGIFAIVLIVYFLFIDRWLLLFHKLTSQSAENAADLIAKAHGYGKDLAKVLFDITIKGETSIQSTWAYNAIRSYHPTVYERIEKLKS